MRKYIVVLVGLVFWIGCFGQEMPKIIPPSPEAASLFKFSEIPVSLYTGLPNIDIPLLEIQSGGVTVPISISYHARGIQVAEIGSRVGLGWTLNAGGMISRQVRDDDGGEMSTYCPNYNSFFVDKNVRYSVESNQLPTLAPFCDLIPDQISFSVNGLSGKMFNGRDGEGWFTQNYSNIKVSPDQIIDSNGNKFIFGTNNFIDTSISMDSFVVRNNNYVAGLGSIFPPVMNTSHLATIKTANGKTISFDYDFEITYYYQRSSDKQISDGIDMESYVSHMQAKQQRIKSIVFDEGRVEFEYDTADREDMPGSHSLKKILLINKNGAVIKQVVFEYEYTTSTDNQSLNWYFATNSGSNLEAKKRMFLKSVQIMNGGVEALPPYVFEYDSTVLPSRHSNSVDVWGYYNGKNNGPFLETLLDDRTVDASKMRAGLLKTMTKPEGGKINFYYEPNKAVNVLPEDKVWIGNPNPKLPRSVLLSNILATVIENNIDLDTGLPYYGGNGNFEDVFVIGEFQTGLITYSSSGEGLLGCPCGSATGCEEDLNLTCMYTRRLHKWNVETQSFQSLNYTLHNGTRTILLEPGKYKLVVKYVGPGLYNPANPNSFFTVGLTWFEEDASRVIIPNQITCTDCDNFSGNKVVFGAGNRIYKIEYIDTDGKVKSTKTYNYLNPTTGYTSGRVLGLTSFFAIKQIPFNGQTATIFIANGSIAGSMFSTYQNNTIGYEHVTEFIGDGANNIGKTEYKFSMIYDTGKYYEFPFHPPTDNEWLRGKELSVTHFENKGNSYEAVQKKQNTYLFGDILEYSGIEQLYTHPFFRASVVNHIDNNIETSGLYEKNKRFFRIPLTILPLPPDYGVDKHYKTYYMTGGTMDLKKTKVTDYFDGGEVVSETVYNYNYDAHYNVSSVQKTTSAGEIIKTSYQYASELLTAPHAQDMVNKNMTSIPLATKTFGDTNLSTTTTEYDCWANCNDTDPYKKLLLPLSIKTSKGVSNEEERIKYNKIDESNGNPLEVEKKDGMKISYIWGYNKTQPVAKLENIAYASIPAATIADIQSKSDLNNNEANLLTSLNALRTSFPNSMITTLTYKPLVGVSTITDPKGQKTTYEYDSFGRLKQVKDHQGNILSENEYHYRTQN